LRGCQKVDLEKKKDKWFCFSVFLFIPFGFKHPFQKLSFKNGTKVTFGSFFEPEAIKWVNEVSSKKTSNK